MNLRLTLTHASLMLRAMVRTPAFSVPVLLFPTMFYTIFALQYAKQSSAIADHMLASYVAFGVIGVTLFQFGVGIANERGRPFERYVRALPVSVATRFSARILVAAAFAMVAAGLIAIVGRLLTPVDFTAIQWLQLGLYAILGALPFVLLGVAIAYTAPAAGANPITNVIYLLCSFVGGLWLPPASLPSFAAAVSPYLPTRAYGELLWSVGRPGMPPMQWILSLVCFGAIFAGVAVAGYSRDEKSRYA